MSEWRKRKYSQQKWKELGDQTKRMRYEKSHAWHFTFDDRDKEAKESYSKNYDLIDWTNGEGNDKP